METLLEFVLLFVWWIVGIIFVSIYTVKNKKEIKKSDIPMIMCFGIVGIIVVPICYAEEYVENLVENDKIIWRSKK